MTAIMVTMINPITVAESTARVMIRMVAAITWARAALNSGLKAVVCESTIW